VFRAVFQPCVPVPDSPPLLLEMLRSPRYSSFIAASSDGKWPRVLVIFRSWKLMDSKLSCQAAPGERADAAIETRLASFHMCRMITLARCRL
jgi:hypothetical protein